LEATPLADIFSAPGKVETLPTKPTKKKKQNAVLTEIFGDFAKCLGVTPQRDRSTALRDSWRTTRCRPDLRFIVLRRNRSGLNVAVLPHDDDGAA